MIYRMDYEHENYLVKLSIHCIGGTIQEALSKVQDKIKNLKNELAMCPNDNKQAPRS